MHVWLAVLPFELSWQTGILQPTDQVIFFLKRKIILFNILTHITGPIIKRPNCHFKRPLYLYYNVLVFKFLVSWSAPEISVILSF